MSTTRAKPSGPSPATVEKFLRDLRTVMRRYNTRASALDEAAAERDRVIRDAHSAGLTPKQLAEATGLTPQRIDQIRRGARL